MGVDNTIQNSISLCGEITRMETYVEPKQIEDNPNYYAQKQARLLRFNKAAIDKPIADLIEKFNRLPQCFTLQSCYGHFVHSGRKDSHNLHPLPSDAPIEKVEYRIAYIAFCVETSSIGRDLLSELTNTTSVDPQNVQLCSADWFWQRQINSYALQVAPERFKHQDTAILEFSEALKIEKVRNQLFARLYELVTRLE